MALWSLNILKVKNSVVIKSSDFKDQLIISLLQSEIASENHQTSLAEGEQATSGGITFASYKFFDHWFRDSGKVFSFLFKKNLKVTNIQIAELVALFRTYTRSNCEKETLGDLHFLSTREFNENIERIVNTFPRQYQNSRSRFEIVAENYGDILKRTVVFEPYFGSCVVYLPCSLAVELHLICASSGYIHSCGANIYIRNVYKATKEELYERLRKSFNNPNRSHDLKTFFRAYSHEDFTEADRRWREA